MDTTDDTESTGGDRERDRVAAELASRLRARGVAIRNDDSNDAVSEMEDAVERFEDEVSSRGGDLMVDEPPRGHSGKPDDPRFRLPLRHADESVDHYLSRLDQATDRLRRSDER